MAAAVGLGWGSISCFLMEGQSPVERETTAEIAALLQRLLAQQLLRGCPYSRHSTGTYLPSDLSASSRLAQEHSGGGGLAD